jgi:hypothetical protein
VLATYEEVYKVIYNVLEEDFGNNLVSNWKNLKVVKDVSSIGDSDLMISVGDVLKENVRIRLNNASPTLFVHRGYLGNHLYKTRKWWRYSINGFANTRLLDIPHSRWPLLNLPKHPWKVKEVKKVLIVTSKMTAPIWDPHQGYEWANNLLDKFPGADVRIRYKASKAGLRWATLWDDFDWADLVIGQASAATVEAFWYGKKVISLFPCPTWAAGCDSTLKNWQDPTEPVLRDQWHEHIAWCQFTNEEWHTSEAEELINKYIGPIDLYKPGHLYNLKIIRS